MSETWVRAAKEGDIAAGSAVEFEVEGKRIALFRTDDGYYAIDGLCPHRGGPLATGSLDGAIVTCPWHAWGFNVKTGDCLAVTAAKLRSYEVKIENGNILVQI